MKPVPIACALLLFVTPAASLAQPVPQTNPQDQNQPESAETPELAAEAEAPEEQAVVVTGKREEVVCRREKPTGSRVAVKTCRTVTALREEQLATQEVMTALQSAGGAPVEQAEEGSGVIGPAANPF